MNNKVKLLLTLPIFSLCLFSCGNSDTGIHFSPREYKENISSIYITVNGAHIPDRSDENYKGYCPAELKYSDDSSDYLDTSGKVRIRGTSSRWFKKKGYKIKFSNSVSINGFLKARNLTY